MKKALSILLLLLVALSLFAGCSKKQTTTADPTPTPSETLSGSDASEDPTADPSSEPSPTPTPAPDFPSDGKVTVSKDGNAAKVQISIPSLAGKEVSAIIIKDPSYRYSWAEDPTGRLCDLTQIGLDDKGAGNATLLLEGAGSTACLVVTTADGASTTLPIN